MKMLIAIVQDQDSHILMDELSERDFRMTKLASTGGFLKAGNTTILMGRPCSLIFSAAISIARSAFSLFCSCT